MVTFYGNYLINYFVGMTPQCFWLLLVIIARFPVSIISVFVLCRWDDYTIKASLEIQEK